MNKIILYTIAGNKTGRFLEKSLVDLELAYSIETNLELAYEKGVSEIPTLEINGVRYKFEAAKQWLRSYARENK